MHYRLVELLKSQGRYDEAIAVYKTWLPLNNNPEPGNDGAFNDRPESYLFELRRGHARYLSAQKDFDAAVELYRTLIEEGDFYITDLQTEMVSPEFLEQYSALVKQQQWESAISLYRQSLQISAPTAE